MAADNLLGDKLHHKKVSRRQTANHEKITDMPIVNNTPKSLTQQVADKMVANIERAIVHRLKYIGEACVNEARRAGSYLDQTGNLRSSIGYVITCDGRIISKSSFPVVKSGKEGAHEGLSYAENLAAGFPKGYCLIVVAGMNYAYYVQRRGKNVLQTSELKAKSEVSKLLRQLGISTPI